MALENPPATAQPVQSTETNDSSFRRVVKRRSFLKGLGVVGAAVSAGSLLTTVLEAQQSSGVITVGDVAILRFLAAAEILETDLWQQYNELGGIQDDEVPGGSGNEAYTGGLEALDEDMPQYIHDNTDDEFSQALSSTLK